MIGGDVRAQATERMGRAMPTDVPRPYYAHSLEGEPPEKWQPLEKHLENVAEIAAGFAKPFGGEEWARLAGLWHDLGKYSNEFQKMLYDANGLEWIVV